jgi:hypothetical protein
MPEMEMKRMAAASPSEDLAGDGDGAVLPV